MKIIKLVLLICAVVGILILITSPLTYIYLQNVYLWPGCYKSSAALDKEANKEIKTLLLNVMKKDYSTLYSVDKNKLYTEDILLTHPPFGLWSPDKCAFIIINYDFMDSVVKVAEDKYYAKVQMIFPDDPCYYFTIKVIDGQYLVSNREVDP